jgi:hypothetical protein
MSDDNSDASKTHYICQTYVEAKGTKGAPADVKIDKQFQYATAKEAESRAERSCQSPDCVGADAYMIVEDPSSGEISAPTFLVRIGNVPEFDDF